VAGLGPDPEQPSLTIDQLTATTGVPSRTIRLYQTKGVLPGPDRRGRVAYYGPAHVDRLRLIGELQDRGLQLSAMRDLLKHGDGDVSIRQWLGLGQQLTQPWSEDRPRTYTSEEVADLLVDRAPGTLAELVRTGVLQRQGEGALAAFDGVRTTGGDAARLIFAAEVEQAVS
jgi:DNA-binding transcriptional MerR regulator